MLSKLTTTLKQDVDSAFQLVQQTQDSYREALAIASDTYLNADGFLALRQEGRAYAAAVMAYSNAVMALLSYMETTRENIRTYLRDTESDVSKQQQS